MLSSNLCKTARTLLNWEQDKLSQLSGLSKQTISNFESGRNIPQKSSLMLLEKIFKDYGIEFVLNDEVGIKGVILHQLV